MQKSVSGNKLQRKSIIYCLRIKSGYLKIYFQVGFLSRGSGFLGGNWGLMGMLSDIKFDSLFGVLSKFLELIMWRLNCIYQLCKISL